MSPSKTQLPEWMLTAEEIDHLYQLPDEPGKVYASAQAQARKLVEWQAKECIEHIAGIGIQRLKCYRCMEQLRQDVGLDS